MQIKNPWKIFSFVIAIALAFSLSMNIVTTEVQAEKQPAMRSALSSLKAAKVSLKLATSDKGGHRVKAIALVDEAIEQVKKGIEADNNNDNDKK